MHELSEITNKTGIVNRIAAYDWHDKDREATVKNRLEAALHAHANGHTHQSLIQMRDVKQAFELDYAEKTVSFLQSRSIPANRFCTHEGDDPSFLVKSKDCNWRVRRIEESDEKVPVEHLRTRSTLKAAGIQDDGIYIGEAVKKPTFFSILRTSAIKEVTAYGRLLAKSSGIVGRAIATACTLAFEFAAVASDTAHYSPRRMTRRIPRQARELNLPRSLEVLHPQAKGNRSKGIAVKRTIQTPLPPKETYKMPVQARTIVPTIKRTFRQPSPARIIKPKSARIPSLLREIKMLDPVLLLRIGEQYIEIGRWI